MKNKICYVAVISAVLSAFVATAADDVRSESDNVVSQFKKADPDMKTFFDNAAGYAVFPNIAKGGLVVGAARGKGMVYQKNQVIGQATITQASFGAQAGGQTFAEILFFETPTALNDFKSGNFELGADISAVAAAAGASKTASYKKGVAVFALPKKGLMVQASVGGQKFKFESLEPTGRSGSESK
jgi:lipid-binding SYLF domain-containing protein